MANQRQIEIKAVSMLGGAGGVMRSAEVSSFLLMTQLRARPSISFPLHWWIGARSATVPEVGHAIKRAIEKPLTPVAC